jgi:hypothetical protein
MMRWFGHVALMRDMSSAYSRKASRDDTTYGINLKWLFGK